MVGKRFIWVVNWVDHKTTIFLVSVTLRNDRRFGMCAPACMLHQVPAAKRLRNDLSNMRTRATMLVNDLQVNSEQLLQQLCTTSTYAGGVANNSTPASRTPVSRGTKSLSQREHTMVVCVRQQSLNNKQESRI